MLELYREASDWPGAATGRFARFGLNLGGGVLATSLPPGLQAYGKIVARIFTTLAVFAMLMLATNLFLGLWTGDYNGRCQEAASQLRELDEHLRESMRERPRPRDKIAALEQQFNDVAQSIEPLRQRTTVHMLFGVAGALVVVLVNSISVTYFIGTSRWCKEVAETYQLDPQVIARSNAIKRGAFPYALTSMLTIVGVIALGAAANPGTSQPGTEFWVTPHLIGAFVGTGLIGWTFLVQIGRITLNNGLINEILAQVRAIREERGLDVEDSVAPAPGAVSSQS